MTPALVIMASIVLVALACAVWLLRDVWLSVALWAADREERARAQKALRERMEHDED